MDSLNGLRAKNKSQTHPIESKYNALVHFKEFKKALLLHDAIGLLNMDSFEIIVQIHDQLITLYPKFQINQHGQKAYSSAFTTDVSRFVGWRPYDTKTVGGFKDKIATKKLVQAHHLPTPRYSFQKSDKMQGVIVKKRSASFGQGISGPYLSPNHFPRELHNDEFFEEFIMGKITKVWFWNDKPICAETQDMMHLVGDGHATIDELRNKIIGFNEVITEQNFSTLLQYFKLELSSVLPKSKRQLVEFRYLPEIVRFIETDNFLLKAEEHQHLLATLQEFGKLFYAKAQEEIIGHLVYTIDFILDQEQKLWFLEANSNPLVHSLIYPHMLSVVAAEAKANIDNAEQLNQFQLSDE